MQEASNQTLDQLFSAMAAARAEISNPNRTRTNSHYKSKYAPLEEVHKSLKPLGNHGIAYFQSIRQTDEGVQAVTTIGHSSGQMLVQLGPVIPVDTKKGAHGVVSATTYAKRTALGACFGIEGDEDDDGNAAESAKPAQEGVKAKLEVKPAYPADKFTENFPTWKAQIADGKTKPADVINTITVRYTLSDEQKNEIKGAAA